MFGGQPRLIQDFLALLFRLGFDLVTIGIRLGFDGPSLLLGCRFQLLNLSLRFTLEGSGLLQLFPGFCCYSL